MVVCGLCVNDCVTRRRSYSHVDSSPSELFLLRTACLGLASQHYPATERKWKCIQHKTKQKRQRSVSVFTSTNLDLCSHKRLSINRIIMKLTIAIFLAGLAECSSSSSSPWPHRRMMHRSLQVSTACGADTDELFANNLDLDTTRNALVADTTATLDACNIDLVSGVDCTVDAAGLSTTTAFEEACQAAGGEQYIIDSTAPCSVDGTEITITLGIINDVYCYAPSCTLADVQSAFDGFEEGFFLDNSGLTCTGETSVEFSGSAQPSPSPTATPSPSAPPSSTAPTAGPPQPSPISSESGTSGGLAALSLLALIPIAGIGYLVYRKRSAGGGSSDGKLDDNAEDVTESNSPDNQFKPSNRQPWLQPRSNGASSRAPQPILPAQDPSFSVTASLDSDSGFPSGVGSATRVSLDPPSDPSVSATSSAMAAQQPNEKDQHREGIAESDVPFADAIAIEQSCIENV